MRWRVKKEPKEGGERWRKRFAWLPVNARLHWPNNVEDRYWVWLESYDQYQRYRESYDVVAGVALLEWITIENYIIN